MSAASQAKHELSPRKNADIVDAGADAKNKAEPYTTQLTDTTQQITKKGERCCLKKMGKPLTNSVN